MKSIRKAIAKLFTLCAVAAVILAVCCISKAADTGTKARILLFPQDHSLGSLYICDASIQRNIKDFHHWIDGLEWKYLGEAKGAVVVPAGQRVMLSLNKTSGNNLSALTQLAPDDLYELHLGRSADDRCLAHLATLTGLKVLHFPRAFEPQEKLQVFTPKGLKQLGALRSLERLQIPDQLTDAGLAALADALPQLRALYFLQNRLTDRGLAVLPKFTALEELSVGGGKITNPGLAVLADLPSLQYLILCGFSLNDNALLQVKKISSLKTLNVGHLKITDAGLAHLAGHPNLENLNLYNTKVTDRGLVDLTSLPSLKALNLGKMDYDRKNPPFTDAGMVHLKAIKSLEQLELIAVGVGDDGLANLAELGHRKRLDLHMPVSSDPKNRPGPSLFTERGVKDLARIRSLESLFIAGPAVTDAVLSDIVQLTNLRSLSLYGCPVSNEGIAKLATLHSVEALTLKHLSQVTVSALNRLNGLPRLSSLRVDSLTQDGPALNLTNLTRLKSLMLTAKKGSTFRDEDLACLANLKQLGTLQLGSLQLAITDAGMAHLAGLTSLERLSLGGPGVTDRGLGSLTNMRGLNFLKISGRFTDAGLQQLEGLKALRFASIYSASNFSPAAKNRLRQSLPSLQQLVADADRSLARSDETKSAHPKPGTHAPDFSVTTLDGTKFTLSEQRGKVVLLHFWGTWCGPCVKGLPALKRSHDRLKQKYGEGVVLLDLVMDDTDFKLRDYVATYKLTTPQARIGLQSELAESYGVTGAPDDFMIGPDGRILLNRESPEGPGDTKTVIDRALAFDSGKRAAR